MKQQTNYHFTNQSDIRYQTIVDLISLATGLDLAISSIKKGEVSQQASDEIRQLIFQSYVILANKVAFDTLQAYEQIPSEDSLAQYDIIIDTPDESHDDIVISYSAKA